MRFGTWLGILLLAVGAGTSPSACKGGDDSLDGGVLYERPQIVPDNNPVCLSSLRPPVQVGQVRAQNVLLQNEGKETLELASIEVVNDQRGHFMLSGVERMSIPSREFSIAQFRYAPTTPGWDTAALQIQSNAENFPRLDIYIVARAEPANLDGGVFDAGPRPMEAEGSCPDQP